MITERLDTIKVGMIDSVVRITLSQPERHNPLSTHVSEEFCYAIRKYAYHPEAKILIVNGEGPSFCAGHDLTAGWSAMDARGRLLEYSAFQKMFLDLENAPVVKIAQVHGHVVGGGVTLASVCDLRYGTPEATFRVPELELGAPFSMNALPRLARLIGLTRAAELVLTGRPMLGTEAYTAGFLTQTLELSGLDHHVHEVATRLSCRSHLVLMETARQLQEAAEECISTRHSELVSLMAAHFDLESQAHGAEYLSRFTKDR